MQPIRYSIFMVKCLLVLQLFSCEINKNGSKAPFQSQLPHKIDTLFWLKETRGIRDLLEDDKGNIWFSSPDYIAQFDGKKMTYFSEKDGLNITGYLHKDKKGTIWVENGRELYRYDGHRFIEENINNISQATELLMQRSFDFSDTIDLHPGIYQINGTETEFHTYPIETKENYKHLYFPTTKAIRSNENIIWSGTMEKVFGIHKDTIQSLGREEMGRLNDERNMGIRGIFIDEKDNLWIADNGAGIFYYDGSKMENFTKKHKLDEHDDEGNTLHRAFSIGQDLMGNMWFGTVYSGIWRYNIKTQEFRNFSTEDGVKSECIWLIYRMKNGEMLFGGESPGAVYRFKGNSFERIF